ncbi:MAG TPA: DUF2177 family protein [Coriobacteriia bacterium]|nr:DUF2177 family protein [Coriobacteriia bacterium]
MPFSRILGVYGLVVVVFFLVDFLWLWVVVPRVYRGEHGEKLQQRPKMSGTMAFYLIYLIGLVALAIVPALEKGSVWAALWRGSLFGLIAYMTYDITSQKNLKEWPLRITVIDIAWGVVINSIVAVAGYYGGSLLGLVGPETAQLIWG